MLSSSNYNPDVLTCIANLSSDEVFTPPQLANRILDLLPDELWSDRKATYPHRIISTPFLGKPGTIPDLRKSGHWLDVLRMP